MPESPATPHVRRPRRLITALFAVVAVGLITVGASLAMSEPDGPIDLNGATVALEPGTTPSPDVVEKMDAVDDAGQRFAIPSVGLSVPLGALSMTANTLTPPGFTSAYLVRNLGTSIDDPEQGTVFVVMHSLREGGVGPGNYLIDVDDETASIAPGITVNVGDLSYTVTGDLAITKTGIQSQDDVWEDIPGKLVIITCLQRPGGRPSHENIVITAQLDS